MNELRVKDKFNISSIGLTPEFEQNWPYPDKLHYKTVLKAFFIS
jgi:hypothetical protein